MKDAKNFACKMDAGIFDLLRQYAFVSRQSKTAIVEMALEDYIGRNMARMQEIRSGKPVADQYAGPDAGDVFGEDG